MPYSVLSTSLKPITQSSQAYEAGPVCHPHFTGEKNESKRDQGLRGQTWGRKPCVSDVLTF